MPEILICKCGNDEWVVGVTDFSCRKCKFVFKLSDKGMIPVWDYNDKIKSPESEAT